MCFFPLIFIIYSSVRVACVLCNNSAAPICTVWVPSRLHRPIARNFCQFPCFYLKVDDLLLIHVRAVAGPAIELGNLRPCVRGDTT
jgi:hypothetical protein